MTVSPDATKPQPNKENKEQKCQAIPTSLVCKRGEGFGILGKGCVKVPEMCKFSVLAASLIY